MKYIKWFITCKLSFSLIYSCHTASSTLKTKLRKFQEISSITFFTALKIVSPNLNLPKLSSSKGALTNKNNHEISLNFPYLHEQRNWDGNGSLVNECFCLRDVCLLRWDSPCWLWGTGTRLDKRIHSRRLLLGTIKVSVNRSVARLGLVTLSSVLRAWSSDKRTRRYLMLPPKTLQSQSETWSPVV